MILKPCPFCKKEIPRSITACPYCHRDEQGKSVVMDTALVEVTVNDRQFQLDLNELASEDTFTRDQAVLRVAQSGVSVVPALVTILSDFSKPGLAGVARALGKIADPRGIAALAHAAKVGDEDLRIASVWALAQIHVPEVLPALLTEAERPHPMIQSYLAHKLATFQDARVRPLLSKLAVHQNREIAFQAACSLGEMGDRAGVAVLQGVWRKGDVLVRAATANSLRRLGAGPARFSWVWGVGITLIVLLGVGVGWYFYR